MSRDCDAGSGPKGDVPWLTRPDMCVALAALEAAVEALDIPDYQLDSAGACGVGEIGITETGAAV